MTELHWLIMAASIAASAAFYWRAARLFDHIERRHPGFNARMRPWCRRFGRKS